MPPAIVASHTYRCTGGDVLYVDFLADGTSINVKQRPSGPSLRLPAPSQGLAFVGDGLNLGLNGQDIQIDEPKKPSRLCTRPWSHRRQRCRDYGRKEFEGGNVMTRTTRN